jgi:hypothetical protein
MRGAAGQEVALDQREEVGAQLVGQGFFVAPAAGYGLVFVFHRPRVCGMG